MTAPAPSWLGKSSPAAGTYGICGLAEWMAGQPRPLPLPRAALLDLVTKGVEPSTSAFGGQRSIQLSYVTIFEKARD